MSTTRTRILCPHSDRFDEAKNHRSWGIHEADSAPIAEDTDGDVTGIERLPSGSELRADGDSEGALTPLRRAC